MVIHTGAQDSITALKLPQKFSSGKSFATETPQVRSVDKIDLDVYEGDNESTGLDETAEPPWSTLTLKKKITTVLWVALKVAGALLLLYFFICSLDLVSVGFRIIGGPNPQKILRVDALHNSVVGLMCGILLTIIVQSSSTTTSAVVGLVAGKIIPIKTAIPIIMGANIGTSVTNTLLAMMQVADRDKFRRAFAAATVHDMFNWLTTLILLPLESLTGYLFYTSHFLVHEISLAERGNNTKKLKLLKALTEPLTKKIVKLDPKVTDQWNFPDQNMTTYESALAKKGHIFAGTTLSDTAVGITLLVLSFVALLTCLFFLVKLLKSILKGKIAIWIRKTSSANLPHCPKLTDYVLMLMGAVLTFVVQSSSAFTSTLPPLVSIQALSLHRCYTLTLGSNIGTTTTAILAAMAQGTNFTEALQISLCHLIFNLTGVLLFYPLPCTRFPIQMSKCLGNTTARYRWFAIVYIIVLFVVLPLTFMGLAFAGSIYVIVVAVFLVIGFLFVVIINSLRKYPRFLPKFFHNWYWLPECLRSLDPYDRLFVKCTCCNRLIKLANTNSKTKSRLPNKRKDNPTEADLGAKSFEVIVKPATTSSEGKEE